MVWQVKFLAYADQDWDTGPGGSPTTASYCLRDAIESGYSDFLLHFGDLSCEALLRVDALVVAAYYLLLVGHQSIADALL